MADTDEIQLTSLLKCLVQCSEKACRIARICRSDKELFSLLIQEKKNGEKNMRFFQDFKTLADVLIQETVRWEITNKFPSLHSSIYGEENNHFQNTLGESINVEISDSVEDTSNLLFTVLDERRDSADLLASVIYENISVDLKPSKNACNISVPASKIGIWIDPIDSTGEYVQGNQDKSNNEEFITSGLKCVCVLLGVYDLETGIPIMGIVNQPFYALSADSHEWASKSYWAICTHGVIESSLIPKTLPSSKPRAVVSGFEDKALLAIIAAKCTVFQVSGSGYKSLLVACGTVDMYVLSLPTISYWDTCGPHCLLLALGGGIVNFRKSIEAGNVTVDQLPSLQVKYSESPAGNDKSVYRNKGGVIVYRNPEVVVEFLNHVIASGYHEKHFYD